MKYEIVIKKKALKFISTIPVKDGIAIYSAIEEMENNPFAGDVKKCREERVTSTDVELANTGSFSPSKMIY